MLADWCATDEVSNALEADAPPARDPSLAAHALDHKLGGPREQRRYTAPSYVIEGVIVPGFNPIETYETVIANRAPNLPRRSTPESVQQLLAWADEPLATAEVALVMQLEIEKARAAPSAGRALRSRRRRRVLDAVAPRRRAAAPTRSP